MRQPSFFNLGGLSSAHRDEVSRVSLEWTAVVLATSTLISVVRTWISPGPDYRVELTLLLVVIAASLAGSHRLTANGRSGISIGLFAFIGAASLLKSGPAGYSPFYLTMAATLAGLFHGRRGWLAACLISASLVGVVGVAASKGWTQTNYVLPPFLRTPMAYVQVILIVVLVSLLLLQVVRALVTQLNEKSYELGERVKELTALHSTSRLLRHARGFDAALLDRIVALLPPAWQYPPITTARVAYGSIEARAEGWRDSPWKQTATFATSDGQTGAIEVVYLEERPAAAEGPFLAEERSLIESLAEMLREHLEQWRAENVIKAANARYSRQEEALAALMRSSVAEPEQAEAVLREVTEVVAATLDVARVGIWRLNAARTALTCRQLFARDGVAMTALPDVTSDRHPSYFQALTGSTVIAVHDALHDPRTKELTADLLVPHAITSILDAPIAAQGTIVGALCCDQVGPPRHWTPDEQTFVAATGNLVSALLAQADRHSMERQLRQAQKMEAIGTLAGGIAHDFNNILSAMGGYTELAKMDIGNDDAVLEHLEAVSKAGNRAADLVRQILSFSRRQEQERKPMRLDAVVGEALELLRATIPTSIDFDIQLSAAPTVLADGTQIHQIVMNLCTNAWHAMRDTQGRLVVRLEPFEVDADFADAHPSLRVGSYARLAVGDTGHGMDPETLSRVFEPFFTTKAPGSGTGLGLSVVHGIMQSHDGGITVYSQPGEGTTFHLYFPAHAGDGTGVTEVRTEIPRGQGQRVLFLDDEVVLAQMGRKMLERLGYVVTTVTDAADAVERFSAAPESFDCLVTDLTMPGLLGTEVADRVHRLRPDLPILLVTGYAATLTAAAVRPLGIRALALKPLNLETLGRSVHQILTAPSDPVS